MEVAYFLTTGYKLKPDVVVLNYFINDAEPTPQRKRSWLAGHSQAYVVISSAIDKASRMFFGKGDWQSYYRDLYGDGQPGWLGAKAAMEKLATYCKDHDIALLVVNYPELHQVKDYPFPEVTAAVANVAKNENLPFLDLEPTVADLVPETLWVSPTDAHPNKIANERFAKAIQEKLLASFPDTLPLPQSVSALGGSLTAWFSKLPGRTMSTEPAGDGVGRAARWSGRLPRRAGCQVPQSCWAGGRTRRDPKSPPRR